LGAAVAKCTESQDQSEEGGMKSVAAVQIETTTTAKEFLESLTEIRREKLFSIMSRPIEHDLFISARAWGLLESQHDEVDLQTPSPASKARFEVREVANLSPLHFEPASRALGGQS
jgi:hypothetical protein